MLERQVRIAGAVERVSREASETYFHARPRGSQIGAWSSTQSSVLASRDALDKHVAEATARFGKEEIPLPDGSAEVPLIEVVPAPLWRAFAAPARVAADTAVRAAQFNVRQAQYTIAVDVVIPKAPDSARMDVRVALDPLAADICVSCAPADSVGIRAALISATTPAWATVKFGRVEQSPDVCQRPVRSRGRSFSFSPLALGVGRVANWGGGSDWALFVGATITWK